LTGDQDANVETQQVRHQLGLPVSAPLGRTMLEYETAAFYPAMLLQTFP
jgi:hypothetical protein